MTTVTSKDRTKIAYDVAGNGPALILVDGALCSSQFGPMPALAKLLKDHFTVYTYDRRGRGSSTDTQPYDIAREVEDIDALISAAGGSAYVYGISSGAILAAIAASKLNDRIAKLALYEAPYGGSTPDDALESKQRMWELVRADKRSEAVELFMKLTGAPDEVIAGMRHAPVWPRFEAVAPTLAYDLELLHDGTVPTDQFAAITAKTLVMYGGTSPAFINESAHAIAGAIPGAVYQVIEGQGHDVAAEAIAPSLIKFFVA